MFFRPDLLDSTTMELLMRGLSQTIAKKRDGTLINEVRNLLITDPDQRHINMDLYALNIQSSFYLLSLYLTVYLSPPLYSNT